jgi:chromosome segregation ATPase
LRQQLSEAQQLIADTRAQLALAAGEKSRSEPPETASSEAPASRIAELEGSVSELKASVCELSARAADAEAKRDKFKEMVQKAIDAKKKSEADAAEKRASLQASLVKAEARAASRQPDSVSRVTHTHTHTYRLLYSLYSYIYQLLPL